MPRTRAQLSFYCTFVGHPGRTGDQSHPATAAPPDPHDPWFGISVKLVLVHVHVFLDLKPSIICCFMH